MDDINNCPLSTIVMTYNEKGNIAACLDNLKSLREETFVVDSFSTGNTVEIGRYTDKIFQNPWEDLAAQRNWALEHLPLSHKLVFFLEGEVKE